jgi:hypothetical protein
MFSSAPKHPIVYALLCRRPNHGGSLLVGDSPLGLTFYLGRGVNTLALDCVMIFRGVSMLVKLLVERIVNWGL